MKRLVFAVFALTLVLAARPGICSTEIDRVVAVVGSETVTLSELQTEMLQDLKKLNQRFRGEDLARETDRLKRKVLDSLVEKYLQLQEAKLIGIDVEKEEIDKAIEDIKKNNKMDDEQLAAALALEGYTLDDYKKTLEEQLTIIRLVNYAVKSKISINADEIDKYYDEHKGMFSEPETVRLAHIFFPAPLGDMAVAEKNAAEARQQILDGTPFEEMAVRCTGDPEQSEKCVLGSFKRGEMDPEMEKRFFSMEQGTVSEPLEVEGGYRLIRVMERSEPRVAPLEEVRGRIIEELSMQRGKEIFAGWIQELRKHTYVEIRDFEL